MEKQDQWELPRHERYRVRQIKGSDGKQIREGTVVAQSGTRICVNYDDGLARNHNIKDWVRIPAEAVAGATAEAAVGATAKAKSKGPQFQ